MLTDYINVVTTLGGLTPEDRSGHGLTSALSEIADDLTADQTELADHAARRALERSEW